MLCSRSFGLTLLAVANGSFPLRIGSETPGAGQWGGSNGYWGMIEAVCDNEPPTTGPEFSSEFSEFIKSCLRKNPDERGTAVELLQHEFIVLNLTPKTPQRNLHADSPWSSDDFRSENNSFKATTPGSSRGIAIDAMGEEVHNQLSSSLEFSMVKKVADKAKRTGQTSPEASGKTLLDERPPLPTMHSVESESNEELITIEAIRTKHFESIVTKLIFRDILDHEHSQSAKYGGTYESGKLIRKESTLDDEVTAAHSIENVDDLFEGKRNGVDILKGTPKRPKSTKNIKKYGKNNADLIHSILMLQGEFDESNSESPGLTIHAHMPKLAGPDLRKWQNLAIQLHLPLDTVIQVAESKLQEALDKLQAEDADNSYGASIEASKKKNDRQERLTRTKQIL